MSRRAYSTLAKIAAEIAVPVAILLALAAWTVHADSQYFPRLSTILVEFRDLWLFSQFGTSTSSRASSASLLGFGIAAVLGIALGIPLGLSRWARLLAMPHIEFWRAIPPPALLPISIILLHSIGNVQKVAFIAFFCLFPVLLNTIDGVRGIDPTLSRPRARTASDGSSGSAGSCSPGRSPQIAAGMRTSLSLAVIIMVLAEYFSSTNGVGYVLLISKNTFEFAPMWAAIVLIGAARLPPEPRLPPRRAAVPRLAPRLARGDGQA